MAGRSASQSALQSAPREGGKEGSSTVIIIAAIAIPFPFFLRAINSSDPPRREVREEEEEGSVLCHAMPYQRGRTFVPRDVTISSADACGINFKAKLCSIHFGDPIQTQDRIVFLYSRSYRQ